MKLNRHRAAMRLREASVETERIEDERQAAGRKSVSALHSLNVGEALQEGTQRLRTVSDTPRVEAEILLMHVTASSRAGLLAYPEHSLTPAQQSRYQKLVARRASGYPLPYLTGIVEFYALDFEVTPEVLIPRPDTEILVDLALARRPGTVIDVGTGSGCIAIALATHLPQAEVYAIDISSAALAVARRNAEMHSLDERIRLITGDLLDRRPGPVDLIVSNPPYVSTTEWTSLPASIRNHEPRLALDGGADGLEVIRRVLSQSQGLLKPGGGLLIEIGAAQGEAAKDIAETFFPGNGTSVRIHQDLAGRDRALEVDLEVDA